MHVLLILPTCNCTYLWKLGLNYVSVNTLSSLILSFRRIREAIG